MRKFILFNNNIFYINSNPTIEISTTELVLNKKYSCRVGGKLDEVVITTDGTNSYLNTSNTTIKINDIDITKLNQSSISSDVSIG